VNAEMLGVTEMKLNGTWPSMFYRAEGDLGPCTVINTIITPMLPVSLFCEKIINESDGSTSPTNAQATLKGINYINFHHTACKGKKTITIWHIS
jgi:hypothetical protein